MMAKANAVVIDLEEFRRRRDSARDKHVPSASQQACPMMMWYPVPVWYVLPYWQAM
ncbi:hypothetical protein [Telmatospirillum siberiense]|uniref:hypothetical protein n=1 Tax=Telmatospirillum siberiense TaxID=382514 RepID=UPI0013046419|nr:hypothetical protein [Telmatospirillum siberiense]